MVTAVHVLLWPSVIEVGNDPVCEDSNTSKLPVAGNCSKYALTFVVATNVEWAIYIPVGAVPTPADDLKAWATQLPPRLLVCPPQNC